MSASRMLPTQRAATAAIVGPSIRWLQHDGVEDLGSVACLLLASSAATACRTRVVDDSTLPIRITTSRLRDEGHSGEALMTLVGTKERQLVANGGGYHHHFSSQQLRATADVIVSACCDCDAFTPAVNSCQETIGFNPVLLWAARLAPTALHRLQVYIKTADEGEEEEGDGTEDDEEATVAEEGAASRLLLPSSDKGQSMMCAMDVLRALAAPAASVELRSFHASGDDEVAAALVCLRWGPTSLRSLRATSVAERALDACAGGLTELHLWQMPWHGEDDEDDDEGSMTEAATEAASALTFIGGTSSSEPTTAGCTTTTVGGGTIPQVPLQYPWAAALRSLALTVYGARDLLFLAGPPPADSKHDCCAAARRNDSGHDISHHPYLPCLRVLQLQTWEPHGTTATEWRNAIAAILPQLEAFTLGTMRNLSEIADHHASHIDDDGFNSRAEVGAPALSDSLAVSWYPPPAPHLRRFALEVYSFGVDHGASALVSGIVQCAPALQEIALEGTTAEMACAVAAFGTSCVALRLDADDVNPDITAPLIAALPQLRVLKLFAPFYRGEPELDWGAGFVCRHVRRVVGAVTPSDASRAAFPNARWVHRGLE